MSRADLSVYNEATGFMITSEGLSGGDYSEVESDDEAWLDAIKEGVFLPFSLVQDDSFVIRVVIGESLTTQEEDEWVGRIRCNLRIPDGRLTIIGGGPEYLWGEDMDDFTRFLDIPPGDYLAELYTYLQSVNGSICLDHADPDEPLGAYFRRTRPGVAFPLWLHNECAGDPELDPGHEAEWRGKKSDYDTEQPLYVSFLLKPSPLGESPPLPELEEGWIVEEQGTRKPAAFPLGLVADHLIADDRDEEEDEDEDEE